MTNHDHEFLTFAGRRDAHDPGVEGHRVQRGRAGRRRPVVNHEVRSSHGFRWLLARWPGGAACALSHALRVYFFFFFWRCPCARFSEGCPRAVLCLPATAAALQRLPAQVVLWRVLQLLLSAQAGRMMHRFRSAPFTCLTLYQCLPVLCGLHCHTSSCHKSGAVGRLLDWILSYFCLLRAAEYELTAQAGCMAQ
jgi:hypothetical protein